MDQHYLFSQSLPTHRKAVRVAFVLIFLITQLAHRVTGGSLGFAPAQASKRHLSYTSVNLAGRYAIQPAALESFSVLVQRSGVRIEWATTSESNSDWFIVERSRNGQTFETIGVVAACGHSNKLTRYVLTDQAPFPGTTYYRLRQIDVDGAEHTFRPVSLVRGEGSERRSGSIFPNPGNGHSVSVAVDDPATARLTLQTLQGSVLNAQVGRGEATHVLRLQPTQPLKPGMYLILIQESTGLRSEKWLVR